MAAGAGDQAGFFRDLAEERAWANRTHDAGDLRSWVARNSPAFAGAGGL